MGIVKKVEDAVEKALIPRRASLKHDKKELGDLSDMGPGEIPEEEK